MKIHFLGTTGYHPNNRRQTSCVMIPELGIILDAGTGIFRARSLIETDSLQVFLTHAHLDHCVGLTYFFDVVDPQQVASVQVYGEQQKLDAIREHLFSELLFPSQPDFEWQPLEQFATAGEIHLPRQGKLTWHPLQHPGGSVGYRLEWEHIRVALITDTTASSDADYVDFIRQVDLLIHECNFSDGDERLARRTGHSCLTPVAELSRRAEVGLTVLTHFNARDESREPLDLAAAKQIFEALILAEDHTVVEL